MLVQCQMCHKAFVGRRIRKFCSRKCGAKKGTSATTRPDGSERVRHGSVEIKINGTWIRKLRHVLQKALGRSPTLSEMCSCIFLDGNKQNVCLDNVFMFPKLDTAVCRVCRDMQVVEFRRPRRKNGMCQKCYRTTDEGHQLHSEATKRGARK